MDFTLSAHMIWFLIGVAFIAAELAVPGFIVVFFGGGAWITAMAVWLFVDMEQTHQILLFVSSSLLLLFGLRKYAIKTFSGDSRENTDEIFSDSKIGKSAVVTKTIRPNLEGEIKVMGSFWRAVADHQIEEGETVKVESHESGDSLVLKVKMIEGENHG